MKALKQYQLVYWRGRWHWGFIKGNPLKQPAAFHLIYAWALWLGVFEIRKWLTDEQREKALAVYIKQG